MSQPSSKSGSRGNAARIDEILTVLPANASVDQGGLSPPLFFEIVQQSPLAISITDNKADILYVNPAFEALTGYEKDQILYLPGEARIAALYQPILDSADCCEDRFVELCDTVHLL